MKLISARTDGMLAPISTTKGACFTPRWIRHWCGCSWRFECLAEFTGFVGLIVQHDLLEDILEFVDLLFGCRIFAGRPLSRHLAIAC